MGVTRMRVCGMAKVLPGRAKACGAHAAQKWREDPSMRCGAGRAGCRVRAPRAMPTLHSREARPGALRRASGCISAPVYRLPGSSVGQVPRDSEQELEGFGEPVDKGTWRNRVCWGRAVGPPRDLSVQKQAAKAQGTRTVASLGDAGLKLDRRARPSSRQGQLRERRQRRRVQFTARREARHRREQRAPAPKVPKRCPKGDAGVGSPGRRTPWRRPAATASAAARRRPGTAACRRRLATAPRRRPIRTTPAHRVAQGRNDKRLHRACIALAPPAVLAQVSPNRSPHLGGHGHAQREHHAVGPPRRLHQPHLLLPSLQLHLLLLLPRLQGSGHNNVHVAVIRNAL